MLTSSPPQFPHACTNEDCDHTEISVNRSYPIVDTVEVHEEVLDANDQKVSNVGPN